MISPENHSPTPGGSAVPPELEARLLAWIAGEASPFEIAELERLVREQSAVAAAKRALEQTHSLLNEAARPDREPLRLSAERRAKLLQEISTPAERAQSAADSAPTKSTKPAAPVAAVISMDRARRKAQHRRSWMLGIAACLTIGTFVGVLLVEPQGSNSAAAIAEYKTAGEEAARKNSIAGKAQYDTISKDEADAAARADELKMRAAQERAFADKGAQREAKSKQEAAPRQRSVEFNEAVNRSPIPVTELRKQDAVSANRYADARSAPLDGRVGGVPQQTRAERSAASDRENPTDLSLISGGSTGEKRRDVARTLGPIPQATFGTPPSPKLADAGDVHLNGASDQSYGFFSFNAPKPPASPDAPQPKKDSAVRGFVSGGTTPATDHVSTSDDSGYLNPTEMAPGGRQLAAGPTPPPASPVISEIFLKELAATNAEGAQRYDADTAREGQAQKRDKNVASANPTNAGTVTGADALAAETGQSDTPLFRAPVISLPPLEEISAKQEPVSTFSMHVGDVSFRLAQKALAAGELPAIDTVRAEEFVNAFRYGDRTPAASEKIACRIEQAAHPLRQQRNLVRIAAKVPSTGRGAGTPLRLTVLLDTSGSMERDDRAATVRAALGSLASLLGPNDRLTLLGFSRTTRLLADSVTGDQAAAAIAQLGALPSEGGTNLEEALRQAGLFARRGFDANAQNRVVLLTDGATNLGNARPAELANLVTFLRQQHIAFDACGVGLDGLDDTVLEALTRQGDGRYYVLDTPAAADAGFARQLAGAFRPAAANVKVQVRFNPARVGNYRLLGFEKHRLNAEDFRNDAVDAAELAADEDATAVYEVEVLPQGEGELGDVFVRFRDTASGEMVERSWTITFDSRTPQFDRASPTAQLAGTAALFAELLRNRPADLGSRLGELAPVIHALRGKFPHDARVAEFVTMFDQARRFAGR